MGNSRSQFVTSYDIEDESSTLHSPIRELQRMRAERRDLASLTLLRNEAASLLFFWVLFVGSLNRFIRSNVMYQQPLLTFAADGLSYGVSRQSDSVSVMAVIGASTLDESTKPRRGASNGISRLPQYCKTLCAVPVAVGVAFKRRHCHETSSAYSQLHVPTVRTSLFVSWMWRLCYGSTERLICYEAEAGRNDIPLNEE
jgi:hypothetical protein